VDGPAPIDALLTDFPTDGGGGPLWSNGNGIMGDNVYKYVHNSFGGMLSWDGPKD